MQCRNVLEIVIHLCATCTQKQLLYLYLKMVVNYHNIPIAKKTIHVYIIIIYSHYVMYVQTSGNERFSIVTLVSEMIKCYTTQCPVFAFWDHLPPHQHQLIFTVYLQKCCDCKYFTYALKISLSYIHHNYFGHYYHVSI